MGGGGGGGGGTGCRAGALKSQHMLTLSFAADVKVAFLAIYGEE